MLDNPNSPAIQTEIDRQIRGIPPNNHVMRRVVKRLAALAVALVVLATASVICVGWLLAHPVQIRVGNPPADLNAQTVSFKSDSGANVTGWWCPISNDRGAVLLLPGIRANRLSMVERARFLRRAGYSILLIDFQATGESKGDRITFGSKESRDVLAAIKFIREMQPSARIAIIGTSLGGAATLLAVPPLKIDALILEAVYPTIEIAATNRLQNYLGPIGRSAAPLLLMQLHARLGVSISDLRPVDHIENVSCPIFLMSGEKDRNTRQEDTRMLFSRAQSPKQLWFVPNAAHVDLHKAATAEYESRVLGFLGQM
jgi:alpha-beta hydrolase superfamily lysophospholipase